MRAMVLWAAWVTTAASGPAGGPIAEVAAPQLAVSYAITVAVASPAQAADQLVAKAEELGGYFAERSDEGVLVRVPAQRVQDMVAAVSPLGEEVSLTRKARDLAPSLLEQRTRLASREQVLSRYFAIIAGAGPDTVVSVEREMTRLVEEIEALKGTIRLAEHQLQLAEVSVRFRFRDRRPPARDGSSSFPWLNTVNLSDLLAEFAQ